MRQEMMSASAPASSTSTTERMPGAESMGAPSAVPAHTRDRGGAERGMADSLLRGAVAGALGALAMTLTHKGTAATVLSAGASMPDPAAKVAEELAEQRGAELSQWEAAAAGTGLSLAFGAVLGAAYGLVQDRLHPPALVHGLALAGLTYSVTVPTHGVLPRMGVQPPPTQQTLEKAAVPIGAHVAFGITTAAIYEALT